MLVSKLIVGSLVLVSSAAAAANVWVVDAAGGAGSQFQSIQLAIDAASDGDLVLVRPGAYAPFSIVGKSLVVTAEHGASFDVQGAQPCEVRNLGAAQQVALRGLHATSAGSATSAAKLASNQGGVWLEACVLRGASPVGTGGVGIAASDSALVQLERCEVYGGKGSDAQLGAYDGGAAAAFTNCASVVLHDCTLLGGEGGTSSIWYGRSGGDGLAIAQSQVFASGGTCVGGDGGDSIYDWHRECYSAGWGGDGADVSGAFPLTLLDTQLSGGLGGFNYSCEGYGGAAGKALATGSSSVVYAGQHRSLAALSPVREGQLAALRFSAPAGELAVYGYSATSAGVPLPVFSGAWSLGAPATIAVAGVVPPTGVLVHSIPIGSLGAGVAFAHVYVQAGYVAGGGSAQASACTELALLDAAF